MTDIVKIYNPAFADALTPEQIAGLQKLKPEQIKELATAYPNASMQRAYLLIIDSKKPVEKQLPQLSTFQNLYNLITKNGMKSFVAYGFRGAVKQKQVSKINPRRSEVLDLSDQELMTLPGFRTKDTQHNGETVTITKVKLKTNPGTDFLTQPPIDISKHITKTQ